MAASFQSEMIAARRAGTIHQTPSPFAAQLALARASTRDGCRSAAHLLQSIVAVFLFTFLPFVDLVHFTTPSH